MTLTIFKKAMTTLLLGLGLTCHASADEKLPIVASFSILGDLVSQVGGEHIELTTLVKENGDAHVYSPTPKDVQAVRNAKVLVTNGLNFEGWVPRLLESSHFEGATIVASTGVQGIEVGEEHEEYDHDTHEHEEHDHDAHEHEEHNHDAHGHHHEGTDPHAWHSIDNVKIYIQNIEKGLSKIDPRNAADYQKNAQAYLSKLEKLDVELHAKIDSIPETQRKVITPHEAFTYFSREFNVEFIAPQGTSTESEASAADMAAIIKQIRSENIKAVFMENISDNRIVEQISQETDAVIGGKLFTGALSETGGDAPTYIEMMRYNVSTIASALK